MRRLLALVFALSLALAEGWVLPFESKNGFSDALALSKALDARDPVFAAIFLPEPPWRDGWRLTLPHLGTPAGARMVAEATGADWVLGGWQDEKGLYHLGLFDGEKSHKAVVGSIEAAALWAGAVLGKPVVPQSPNPAWEPVLRLALQNPMQAAEIVQAHGDEALAQNLRAYAAALAHGKLDILPEPLRAFWIGFHDPKKLPAERMGLVWRTFLSRGKGPALEALIESPLLLHQTAAVLVLQSNDDPRWKALARKIPKTEPLYAWGYEVQSFAAFEDKNAEEARDALLAAIRLNPKESLYWTNLGWAYYLTGDLPRARLASEYALKLEENPTARYNLGLFHALWGAALPAQEHYQKAVRIDDHWEIKMALLDLEEARKKQPFPTAGYWRGLLFTYAGEPEKAHEELSSFLQNHPDHPLAPWAKRLLAQNKHAWQDLSIEALSIRENGKPLTTFGRGEPLWVKLRFEGEPALPGTKLTLELIQNGKTVRYGIFFEHRPPYPPNTVGYTGWVGPLPLPEKPGRYFVKASWGHASEGIVFLIEETNLARQFYARGLLPRDLDGAPLVPEDTLLSPNGEERLIKALLEAVRQAAPAAAQVETFATPLKNGKSVAEMMQEADEELVRAYLEAALENPELLLPNAVEGFARWLLEAHKK